ncbi:hypothetical protein V496_05168 [Pseudogymnoascus sp. VKM F-4515 (FW-2607)]|nr:hypothetical protein V496_05168 [Pseudogymnoascus sp. VKM F-4515 (FW-2607)]
MSSLNTPLTGHPSSLEETTVKSLPGTVCYVTDFITKAEEAAILEKIATAPKPRWKALTHRRLQTWPADLANNTLLESPLPSWLINPIIPRILSLPMNADDTSLNVFSDSPHKAPNHVLINEYLPGQGIMPHKDGSAYHPVVCTVSLGSSLCLDIYGSNEHGGTESGPRWKILQEPRSLLITTGEMYTKYLHGIADVTADINLNNETVANWDLLGHPELLKDGVNERQIRTSLTYRDVLKVSKLGRKLFGTKA